MNVEGARHERMVEKDEQPQSFYYSRCKLFSQNHPILKEDYNTKFFYFTVLYTVAQKNFKNVSYLHAVTKVYRERFNLPKEDYEKIVKLTKTNDQKEQLDMLRVICVGNLNVIGWQRYKYVCLAHILLLTREVNEVSKSVFFLAIADYLDISPALTAQIVTFVKKVNEHKFEEAGQLLAERKEFRYFNYFIQELVNYQQETNQKNCKILVVANMSAGKSTFINSIIGKDLLPSKNEACTDKTISLQHNNRLDFFIGRKLGNATEIDTVITSSKLIEWNQQNEQTTIELEGNLFSLISKNYNITLVDTPGTNNSRDTAHSTTTLERLQKGDFHHIFYVINAANMGTDDDRSLLTSVLQQVSKERWSYDITFIINKMDEIDVEANESIEGVMDNARKYVMSLGISKPKMIPYSAYAALLLQKYWNNQEMTRKEKKNIAYLMDTFLDDDYALPQFSDVEQASVIDLNAKKLNGRHPDLTQALRNAGYFTVMSCLAEVAGR